MDFSAPRSVSQRLHLTHVSIIKVLYSVDLGYDIVSVLCCDFNLFEQILILNKEVIKFAVILFIGIIFWHFHLRFWG